jgi:putative redox protein
MTSTVTNLGGLRFMGETADGQRAMIDNEKVARTGMSPMQLVLNAVAACAGMDVSVMLGKRKLPVKTYRIEVSGERPDENPAPFTRIVARHVFDVPGLDREMAERFVDLATNKYCSVGASLNASVDWEVELLDATGASLGVTGPKVGATVGAAE